MHFSQLKLTIITIVSFLLISHNQVLGYDNDFRVFRFDTQDETNRSGIHITLADFNSKNVTFKLALSYPEQQYGLHLTTFGSPIGSKRNFTSLKAINNTTFYNLNISEAVQEGACVTYRQNDNICQLLLESEGRSITFFVRLDEYFSRYARIYGTNPVSNLISRNVTISEKKSQEFQALLSSSLGISFTGDQDNSLPDRTFAWEKNNSTRAAALPLVEPFMMFYQCSDYFKVERLYSSDKTFSAQTFNLNMKWKELRLDKEDRCNVTLVVMDTLRNSMYPIRFKNQLEIHVQGAGTIIIALVIVVAFIAFASFALWFVTERLGGKLDYRRDLEALRSDRSTSKSCWNCLDREF